MRRDDLKERYTLASDEPPSWLELTCRVPAEREEDALARLSALGWEQCAVEQPLGHEPTEDDWRVVPQDAAHVLIRVYTLAEDRSPEEVAAELQE
ncbi:MAG: hypothetical protein HYU66_00465, partial [Armatimonadetes bacterium]|nr:hypothetical protein [Armatimonadota bacterium]